MLDGLLAFGRAFDWITPTVTAIQNIANGPSEQIAVNQSFGFTGGEIKNALQGRGIETWGHMIINGYIMLRVRKRDFDRAYDIVEKLLEGGPPKKSW